MNSSTINLFLSNQLSGFEFSTKIQKEVIEYTASMKKVGSSISLYLSEDELIYFDKHTFVKLLNEVLLGNISIQGLSYLCDCFTLGERIEFQNELIKDFVFEIADPEINGGFRTASEIIEIIQKVNADK